MQKAKPFDAADYLDSPAMIVAYLNETFASEDPTLIAKALDAVARGSDKLETLSPEMLKRITELTNGMTFVPDEDIEGAVDL